MNKALTAAKRDLEIVKSQLDKLEEKIEKLSATGPQWQSSDGEFTPIASMTDLHLLNSIRVCLDWRGEYYNRGGAGSRYVSNAKRQAMFLHLVLEAQKRGIIGKILLELDK